MLQKEKICEIEKRWLYIVRKNIRKLMDEEFEDPYYNKPLLFNFVNVEMNENDRIQKNYLKMLDVPYIGKINFKTEDYDEDIYIGLEQIENNNKNILVYDTKSRFAELFFDNDIGDAKFVGKNGTTIKGTIQEKYFVEINKRTIKVTEDNVPDEMQLDLIKKVNKSIVITKDDCVNLMLYRIKYNQYREESMSNGYDTLIVSPSNIVIHEVSAKMPKYAIAETYQCSMDYLITKYISEFRVLTKRNTFNNHLNIKSLPKTGLLYRLRSEGIFEVEKEIVKYKMSDKFLKILDKYLDKLKNNLPFKNVYSHGNELFSVKKDDFYKFDDINNDSVKETFEDLIEKLKFLMDIRIPNREYVEKEIKALKNHVLDPKKLYISLFMDKKLLYELAGDEDEFDLLTTAFYDIVNGCLRQEDTHGYIYFKSKLVGFEKCDFINKVIVHEAQNYSYPEMMLLKGYFPDAIFTIYKSKLSAFYTGEYEIQTKELFDCIDFENEAIVPRIHKYLKSDTFMVKAMIETAKKLAHRKTKIGLIIRDYNELHLIKRAINERKYDLSELHVIDRKDFLLKEGINIAVALDVAGVEFDTIFLYKAEDDEYTEDDWEYFKFMQSLGKEIYYVYRNKRVTFLNTIKGS